MYISSDELEAGTGNVAPDPSTGLRLSELLGSGRHGMVFLGLQTDGGDTRTVAVKVPNHPDGLQREGLALEQFRNPHIIELIDGPLRSGALVLEHCDLGTLADRLAYSSLTVSELRGFVDSMILALSEIHDAGWIHGDVSPTNIGLRSDAGPVLLDFATAKPSDGNAIDEGNVEFAGPLRQAEPRLDVRSLAATALHALGETDRWDNRKTMIQRGFEALIERCDGKEVVELCDVAAVVRGVSPTMPAGAPRGGRPHRTETPYSTRTFGPRPNTATSSTRSPSNSRRADLARRIWLPAMAIVVALAVVSELVLVSTSAVDRPERAQLTQEVTASQSLEDAGAAWDADSGVVTLATSEGSIRLAVGEAGDAAAIADWSCDGVATLGVYRPRTGSWFVFDSWLPDSASGDADRLERAGELVVHVDSSGCAHPMTRSANGEAFSAAGD